MNGGADRTSKNCLFPVQICRCSDFEALQTRRSTHPRWNAYRKSPVRSHLPVLDKMDFKTGHGITIDHRLKRERQSQSTLPFLRLLSVKPIAWTFCLLLPAQSGRNREAPLKSAQEQLLLMWRQRSCLWFQHCSRLEATYRGCQ